MRDWLDLWRLHSIVIVIMWVHFVPIQYVVLLFQQREIDRLLLSDLYLSSHLYNKPIPERCLVFT